MTSGRHGPRREPQSQLERDRAAGPPSR